MQDQGAEALSYIAGTVDRLATFPQTVKPRREETLDSLPGGGRGPRAHQVQSSDKARSSDYLLTIVWYI